MDVDKSVLLQKQVRDNSEDLRSEFLDMKNWEEQMKRKERELLSENAEQKILPPIRSRNKKKPAMKENKNTENSKRIKACDYAAWDKFDVDTACKEFDKEEQSDEYLEEEPMSKEELEENHMKATEHKLQGNIFVQQKQWDKAIASYGEAIKIFPYDAVFYANRALCYLKQDNLYSVEIDCSSAIQLDEIYVKAYHRRATARMGLKQYKEAKQDVEKILMLEPTNKEATVLLDQINKWLEDLKPAISGEDKAKDIPMKKKIAEKMLNGASSNNKLTDINKIKEDSLESSIKSGVESITESKRDLRIPAWLPEKDNVEIVEPVEKPAHLRSKEPLKRILVQEADLSKPIKTDMKTSSNINQHAELLNVYIDGTEICNKIVEKLQTEPKQEQNFLENSIEIPPIPKTAVQFLIHWRKCSSSDFRYKYLKQLRAGDLPKIFQDSMESDIFSNILVTLKTEFVAKHEPIFSYLKDLSNIKRFRAFIMFISNSEKQDLKLMFSYCKTSEGISEEEIAELQNKYEN